MSDRPLVLASGSPRRAELLRQAGIRFEVSVPDVDETLHPGEAPEAYVRRLAAAKARHVAASHPGRPVLGADTTVVVDGQVLGKPYDAADAARMLGQLSGRSHLVLTGVCLIGPAGETRIDAAVTTVEFRALQAAEIGEYVDSGEPMDKAGGYAIQGGAAGFVTRLDGEYSNVVGLPVALIQGMCRASGIQVS
jgi:septum formation protein